MPPIACIMYDTAAALYIILVQLLRIAVPAAIIYSVLAITHLTADYLCTLLN